MTNRFWRVVWRMSNSFFGHIMQGVSIGVIVPLVMHKTEGFYCNNIKGVPTRRQELRALCTESPEGRVRRDEFQVLIKKCSEGHDAFIAELEHLREINSFFREIKWSPSKAKPACIDKIDELVEKTNDLLAERERIEKIYALELEHCKFESPVDKHKKFREYLKDTDRFIKDRKHDERTAKFVAGNRALSKIDLDQMAEIREKAKELLAERARIEIATNKDGVFPAPAIM